MRSPEFTSFEWSPGRTVLGKYKLETDIGKGNFGTVWRALGEYGPYALKYLDFNEEKIYKTHLEKKSLEILRHRREEIDWEHLIRIHAAPFLDKDGNEVPDETNARWLVIVLDLAEKSLADRLEELQKQGHTGIPMDELMPFMIGAAAGIDHLNLLGIRHNDIKPANLLLQHRRIKVADFGVIQATAHTITTHAGCRTDNYAAPEVLLNGKVTARSDLYALAATFLHLLSGQLLHREIDDWNNATPSRYPALELLSEMGRQIFAKALAKKPDNRWGSCAEFVQKLAGGAESVVECDSPLSSIPAGVSNDTEPATRQSKWTVNRIRIAIVLAFAGVILLPLIFLWGPVLLRHPPDNSISCDSQSDNKSNTKLESVRLETALALPINQRGQASAITTDKDSNIYITAQFCGKGAFDPKQNNFQERSRSQSYSDCLVMKYDSKGHLCWWTPFQGSTECHGSGIAIDSKGYVYVVGRFGGKCRFGRPPRFEEYKTIGGEDAFLAKLDNKDGVPLWVKPFGGNARDEAESVAIYEDKKDKYVFVAGSFQHHVDFDRAGLGKARLVSEGKSDIFFLKLDSNGKLQSSPVSFGGPQHDTDAELAVDHHGHVYLAGSFQNRVDFRAPNGPRERASNGKSDVFILKLVDNQVRWVDAFGDRWDDVPGNIAVDPSGNIHLAGQFTGNIQLGFDQPKKLQSNGRLDAFLVKWNPSGGALWANQFGGVLDDCATGVAVDEQKNVYLTGAFQGIANFDSTKQVQFRKSSKGKDDVFMVMLDPTGNTVRCRTVGDRGKDIGLAIAVDPLGNIHVTGSFQETVDFHPTRREFRLTSWTEYAEVFLWKLHQKTQQK